MGEKQRGTSPNSLSCPLSFLLLSHGFLSAEPNWKSESGSPCDTSCWAWGRRTWQRSRGKGSGEKPRQTDHAHHTPFSSNGLSLESGFLETSKERNILDFLLTGERSASVINWKHERDMFLATAQVWEGILASCVKHAISSMLPLIVSYNWNERCHERGL